MSEKNLFQIKRDVGMMLSIVITIITLHGYISIQSSTLSHELISLITPNGHIYIRSSKLLLLHASDISNCNDVQLQM